MTRSNVFNRPRFAIHLLACFTCAALLLFGAGCRRGDEKLKSIPPADPRIIGTWSLVGGDYPLENEYRANGTMVQQVGVGHTAPSPYRIEGEYLTVYLKQTDGQVSEFKNKFSID